MSLEKKHAIRVITYSLLMSAISVYAFIKIYPQNYCPSPKFRFAIMTTLFFISLFELLNKKEEDAVFNIYMAMFAITAIVTSISFNIWYKVIFTVPFGIYVLIDLYLENYRIKSKTFARDYKQSFEDVFGIVRKINHDLFTSAIVHQINYKTNSIMETLSLKRDITIDYSFGNSRTKLLISLGTVPNAIKGINKKDLLYCAVDVEDNPNLVIDSIQIREEVNIIEIDYVVRKYKNLSSFAEAVLGFANYVGIFSNIVTYDSDKKQLYRKYNIKFDM